MINQMMPEDWDTRNTRRWTRRCLRMSSDEKKIWWYQMRKTNWAFILLSCLLILWSCFKSCDSAVSSDLFWASSDLKLIILLILLMSLLSCNFPLILYNIPFLLIKHYPYQIYFLSLIHIFFIIFLLLYLFHWFFFHICHFKLNDIDFIFCFYC